MPIQHKILAAGKWHTLTLSEQLGNIGSEVSRALRWKNKDENLYTNAIDRALELLDMTTSDPRWRMRLKELLRARELLLDAAEGGTAYHTSLQDLESYFFSFALAARSTR